MRSAGRATLAIAGALMAGLLVAGCTSSTSGDEWRDLGPAAAGVTTPVASAPQPSSNPEPVQSSGPVRTPCSRNDRHKWVFVSLRRQHMWMCGKHRVAAETAITSGMVGAYTHTPTGRYRIQGLNRNSTLTLNTGATYAVKFWIPFDAPLFGFHDSSWQHFPYGSSRYRTEGSHGCIHMPLPAMKFLYDWVQIGATVRIDA
jgi:hypothetical protein